MAYYLAKTQEDHKQISEVLYRKNNLSPEPSPINSSLHLLQDKTTWLVKRLSEFGGEKTLVSFRVNISG